MGSYSDPKYFALIMQPVGECSLSEYYATAAHNPDALSLLRSFVGCLAGAVSYLHAQRIRHRDIKPQNIIVRGDEVLLTDFGIAYHWGNLTRGTTTADSGKTLVYAAPEVVHVEPRNTAADVWSLGCVVLEIATLLKGRAPRDAWEFFKHAGDGDDYSYHANRESIPRWAAGLRDAAPKSDNAVLSWALGMLQAEPSARPTAAAVFEEVAAVSRQVGILFTGPCCLDGADSSTDEEGEDDEAAWEDDVDPVGA
jgi:serine/threonine protein kinase